jgi:hypothetical protein
LLLGLVHPEKYIVALEARRDVEGGDIGYAQASV